MRFYNENFITVHRNVGHAVTNTMKLLHDIQGQVGGVNFLLGKRIAKFPY